MVSFKMVYDRDTGKPKGRSLKHSFHSVIQTLRKVKTHKKVLIKNNF